MKASKHQDVDGERIVSFYVPENCYEVTINMKLRVKPRIVLRHRNDSESETESESESETESESDFESDLESLEH